jgi:hypothetical protein
MLEFMNASRENTVQDTFSRDHRNTVLDGVLVRGLEVSTKGERP